MSNGVQNPAPNVDIGAFFQALVGKVGTLDPTKIKSDFDSFVRILPFFSFIPQVASVLPLIPVIDGLLGMVIKLRTAGHDPQAVAKIVTDEFASIAAFLQQLHGHGQQAQPAAMMAGGGRTDSPEGMGLLEPKAAMMAGGGAYSGPARSC